MPSTPFPTYSERENVPHKCQVQRVEQTGRLHPNELVRHLNPVEYELTLNTICIKTTIAEIIYSRERIISL